MNPFKLDEVKEIVSTVSESGKTNAFEKSSDEVKEPRKLTTINENLEGQKHTGTNVEYRKHTFMINGEKVQGVFPEFNSKFDVRLPKEMRTASDSEQFKYCTQQLAKRIESTAELAKLFSPRQLEQIKNCEPRIAGLTWHHNEEPGKMQLVDANEHECCRHTGGRCLWGGGSDCR